MQAYAQLKNLNLRLVNLSTRVHHNPRPIPRDLQELQDLEDEFNRSGEDVSFFYEDPNSGDRIPLDSFSGYVKALQSVGGQGLLILYQAFSTAADVSVRAWNCRKCMRRNQPAVNQCATCDEKKPPIPGTRVILG